MCDSLPTRNKNTVCLDFNFRNPCDLPMLRKLFRPKVTVSWNIIEIESVDKIISRTTKVRNRLILELPARGRLRIAGVLKLKLIDIQDRLNKKQSLPTLLLKRRSKKR